MSASDLTPSELPNSRFPASLPSRPRIEPGSSDNYLPLPDISKADGSPWAGCRFTVLAVGNPIMGDDGIGLEILAELQGLVSQRPAWKAAIARGEMSR
ncbi:MAG: hypothetical protein ACLS7Q_04955 [Varibaculum cambriense]